MGNQNVTRIENYNTPVESDWKYFELFRKAMQVKYVKSKGDKPEMTKWNTSGATTTSWINPPAFVADAYNETARAINDYIQATYNYVAMPIESKRILSQAVKDLPVPTIFDVYKTGLELHYGGKTFMIPVLLEGVEQVRYNNLLTRLINNGYTK